MSGRPLLEKSNDVLSRLRGIVGREYPLIGVGGVFDADDAAKKIAAGADLIQAYTGFIYEGPMFVKKIVGRL
jgi:dihydroorotate dehydrogenase